jgi:hypothetical protein
MMVAVCDPNPRAMESFATAAARHYSGTIPGIPPVRYWQGINEPNLSLFFNPQFNEVGRPVSPALYRKVANAFYAGINAAPGNHVVVLGGLGPVAVPGYTVGPMRFTRQLLCMRGRRKAKPVKGKCDGGVHFDIFDIHPYTTGSPIHEGGVDDVQLGRLPQLVALIRAADRAGRIKGRFPRTPVWITEFGWDSDPPDPGGLKLDILVRWTSEALYRAWRAGVDHFFWYQLRDGVGFPSFSETVQSGLYFRGATPAEDMPKPSLQAFKFPFVAYPRKRGLVFWGRTPDSQAGSVKIQVRGGSGWRTIMKVRAKKNGIFEGLAATGYGAGRKGFARAVYRGEESAAFSMKPVADFYQPPFG